MSAMEHDRIARAAGVVGSATLLSRILGYARDMVIAYFFGAGLATDEYPEEAFRGGIHDRFLHSRLYRLPRPPFD